MTVCRTFRYNYLILFFSTITLVSLLPYVTCHLPDDIGSSESDTGEETWLMWIKRQRRFVTNGGGGESDIPTFQNKYEDEAPDPKESWKTWIHRQFCSKGRFECCVSPYVRRRTAIHNLQKVLDKEFFGQHLAKEITIESLAGHLNDEPRRPLLMSFHGWVGSGKTYLAQHIVAALFKKGEKSRYVKIFRADYDFPLKTEAAIETYRNTLQTVLLSTAARCEYALFIFDEVDMMPPGLLDTLAPFLDNPAVVEGVSFQKAIFIFLSNQGSTEINKITEAAWMAGKMRENLTLKDFEQVIQKTLFNTKGSGFYQSALIHRILVDYSIPFLPMERRHVKQCIRAEAERQGVQLDPDQVIEMLTYWPDYPRIFSDSGCKKIEKIVRQFKAKLLYSVKHERSDL